MLPLSNPSARFTDTPLRDREDRSGLLDFSVAPDRSWQSPCGRFWRYMKAEHPAALIVTGVALGVMTFAAVPAAVTYVVTKDLIKTGAVLGAEAVLVSCIGNFLHKRADRLNGQV
jgi:hypothetical protein